MNLQVRIIGCWRPCCHRYCLYIERSPWSPRKRNSLHFGGESLPSNHTTLRMRIRIIERVHQKPNVRRLQRFECLIHHNESSVLTLRSIVRPTGFSSPSLRPIPTASLPSRPHMSSTMTNLVPVAVSQPQRLNLSSRACRRPRSWSIRLRSRVRSSKISRDAFRWKEKSR